MEKFIFSYAKKHGTEAVGLERCNYIRAGLYNLIIQEKLVLVRILSYNSTINS